MGEVGLSICGGEGGLVTLEIGFIGEGWGD